MAGNKENKSCNGNSNKDAKNPSGTRKRVPV